MTWRDQMAENVDFLIGWIASDGKNRDADLVTVRSHVGCLISHAAYLDGMATESAKFARERLEAAEALNARTKQKARSDG